MALPLVLLVLTVLGASLGALSYLRAGMTRRLEALAIEGRLLSLAEAALDEAAQEARLAAAWQGTELDRLRAAFEGGEWEDGVVRPRDAPVRVEPAVTRTGIRDPALELDPVEARLVEYVPFARSGTLRLSVEVRARLARRTVTWRVVADYECSLYDAGGTLGLLVSRRPRARRAP